MKNFLRHIIIYFFSLPLWGGLGWGLLGWGLLVSSCKPSLPSHVISEGDMEDILYDYHIAKAMMQHDEKLKAENLYADILKKYDYTQADFDTSMVYYTRHYGLLSNIYGRIEERMMTQAVAMGGNVQDLNTLGEGFASADTTNIWSGESSLIFLQYEPYHTRQFDIKVDTTYKAGDKLLLSFDADFLIQDGSRDLIAMFAMRLKNDSVVYTSQHISYPTHGSLTISDNDRHGIKSITGFFTFKTGAGDPHNTVKVALVRNLKIIRMHTEDPNKEKEEETDDNNETKQDLNNGLQETSLDSSSRTTPDSLRREGAVLPKKRMPNP